MWFHSFLVWLHHYLATLDRYPLERGKVRGAAGQGLVEYAIILVLIGVVAMALLVLLTPTITNMFQTIYNSMQQASGN